VLKFYKIGKDWTLCCVTARVGLSVYFMGTVVAVPAFHFLVIQGTTIDLLCWTYKHNAIQTVSITVAMVTRDGVAVVTSIVIVPVA